MAGARKGIRASAQDNFLEPMAPTGFTATDVGTNRAYNNGAANLSWTLPAASPAATNYQITASPSIGTINTNSSATSYTVTGLSSGTAYTFYLKAQNAAGYSAQVNASATITTVPQAPTASASTGAAGASPTPSSGYDRITFSANATGGKAITSYRVASNLRGTLSSAATSPYDTLDPTLPDSSADENYTVYASNANGESAGTSTSNIQTFTPPHFPPFFPPYFPPFFPPFFPPHFPPFFPPHFPPFFPPFFPPHFPPFFPPHFPPFFPPFFPPHFPPFFPPHFPPFFPPFFPPYFPPFFPPHFPPFFPPFFPPYFPPFFPPHFPPFFPPHFPGPSCTGHCSWPYWGPGWSCYCNWYPG